MRYVLQALVACVGVVLTILFVTWLTSTIVSAFDNHDVGLLIAICADCVVVLLGFLASVLAAVVVGAIYE